jgi:3-hydroxyacyl-CoA dehydrogenase/enoyl-CoA hydratase/3-hydroxybutyryl-CoA epimerase
MKKATTGKRSRGARKIVETTVDADGIATLLWNDPDLPVNVMSERALGAFRQAFDKAAANRKVKGIVLASAKETFHAGADLASFQRIVDPATAWEVISYVHQILRAIETCGKPVVAAINGSALGGGCELTLACHHRIAADNPKSRIGLPELRLGLFPGAGGTQRLPRLIGLQKALEIILEGRTLPVDRAFAAGLVDEVVAPDRLLRAAKRWIRTAGVAAQPWDEKGFRLPGGEVQSPRGKELFVVANALLRQRTYGNYPNALAAMESVYNGCQIAFDAALRQEARTFASLFGIPSTRNMVRTTFFRINDARKGKARPKGIPPASFKKIAVVGAGFMGAGIAHVSARAGLRVVLLDVSREAAEKGKAHAARLLEKAVGRGRMGKGAANAILRRIRPTESYADLKGCDLVVEAVFENFDLKRQVIGRIDERLPKTALFATNTSTLPITALAKAFSRPGDFIGIHFFSPVEKMHLVEIIVGKETSDEALAKALDYVRVLGKTPIVVNDSHGFFTSRVVATYIGEGVRMLAEGVAPALIENAARNAGMPVGPLTLADEVGIDVMYRIQEQARQAAGGKLPKSDYDEVAELFAVRLKRMGRKSGGGFYAYPKNGGTKRLWPELSRHFPWAVDQPPGREVEKRLMHLQALETVRCLEENVLRAPEDADVGSVLGWGFAPFSGGAISYIDNMGAVTFVTECRALARKFGPRFKPTQGLAAMAKKGMRFYPD